MFVQQNDFWEWVKVIALESAETSKRHPMFREIARKCDKEFRISLADLLPEVPVQSDLMRTILKHGKRNLKHPKDMVVVVGGTSACFSNADSLFWGTLHILKAAVDFCPNDIIIQRCQLLDRALQRIQIYMDVQDLAERLEDLQ